MYRSCIFCSAALGANQAVEHFPVGRKVAFDAERGRLWAVCPKCARWNLAPLEERWEAVEEAERTFRETRLRVQRENIGVARLQDGAYLVRIGDAEQGELAAWRYGRELRRRRLRARLMLAGGAALPLAVAVGALSLPVLVAASQLDGLLSAYREIDRYRLADRVAYAVNARHSPTGLPLRFRWRDLALVRVATDAEGRLALHALQAYRHRPAAGDPLILTGAAAAGLLGTALVRINGTGAGEARVDAALRRLSDAGGAEAFVRTVADRALGLEVPGIRTGEMFGSNAGRALAEARERALRPVPLLSDPVGALALEMALNEERERRALDGELAELEAAWREAEEIAAIADRLPDVPPSDPTLVAR